MESSNDLQTMLAHTVAQMLDRYQPTKPSGEGASHPDLWAQLVDVGLTAAEFPASLGGLEIAFADLGPAIQQCGQAQATTYLTEFIIMGGWLVGQCAASAAEDIMPRLISGDAKIALASNEYGLGGEIALTTTSAVQYNGGWTLDGNKSVVVGGDRATHILVPARIMPSDANQRGELGLYLLPTNTAGVTAHTFELYDGSGAADFELRDARVAADALLCRGKMAVDLFELALDRGRAALSHETVGLLERVCEITLDYVKTRKQFGQPIGAFQTMQHRMADMVMDIELAKSCAQLATDAISAGTSESQRMQTISAAMASICDCSRRVGQSAVQAHGAIALTQEYLVGHYFKRLTMLERYLGNADFHLERYVALDETEHGRRSGSVD